MTDRGSLSFLCKWLGSLLPFLPGRKSNQNSQQVGPRICSVVLIFYFLYYLNVFCSKLPGMFYRNIQAVSECTHSCSFNTNVPTGSHMGKLVPSWWHWLWRLWNLWDYSLARNGSLWAWRWDFNMLSWYQPKLTTLPHYCGQSHPSAFPHEPKEASPPSSSFCQISCHSNNDNKVTNIHHPGAKVIWEKRTSIKKKYLHEIELEASKPCRAFF